jgi:organic radical activating enzyme
VQTKEMNAEDILHKIGTEYKRHRTKKVCLLGGDPLYISNIDVTRELLEMNAIFEFCLYTGYSKEYVWDSGIKGFTYLKTGQYFQELSQIPEKNDKYFQLSSTNQKIYDKDFTLLSKDGKMEY